MQKTFSELKGGPLKLAQMLSIDKNLLPPACAREFAQAQYSAPPMSYPLVIRTFRRELRQRVLQLCAVSIELLGRPFREGSFDFVDERFIQGIYQPGEDNLQSRVKTCLPKWLQERPAHTPENTPPNTLQPA
ncbi:MAG: hypothetical protein WEB60_11720 [Terrimicrobiaceae bacterium]